MCELIVRDKCSMKIVFVNKRNMCSTGPGGQHAALAYSNTDHFAQHVLIVPYEMGIVDITVVSFLCRNIHGPASLIRELELHLDRFAASYNSGPGDGTLTPPILLQPHLDRQILNVERKLGAFEPLQENAVDLNGKT